MNDLTLRRVGLHLISLLQFWWQSCSEPSRWLLPPLRLKLPSGLTTWRSRFSSSPRNKKLQVSG